MAKTFRTALAEAMRAHQMPLATVADATGVSYDQLRKLLRRDTAKTNYEDALKIAAYFGMTLNEFLEDDLAADRARLVETYLRLTEGEREILRAAAQVQILRDRAPSKE